MSALEETPPAATPCGYTLDGSQHVVYRASDSHIHELYSDGGSMWAHTDLSVAANSAHLRAAGNPAGYTLGNSQHVVCRGSDGHIHEFYWQGGSWAHNDLTEASNSTHLLAASDPSCYTLGDSQHVIYRGVDGHIHELYWEGRQWAHHDLTVASNSVHVPAASDPAGYTLGKSQHAVYRGADGRIHELYWQGGSKWTHHDLTAASNSGHLSAVGDPAASPSR